MPSLPRLAKGFCILPQSNVANENEVDSFSVQAKDWVRNLENPGANSSGRFFRALMETL